MRALIAILLAFVTVSVALAQTPEPPPGMNSSVTITVVTGANGSNDNLRLELSGTFPGDPYAVTLDQPGDLQPGTTNSYNFIVPHTFCEIFQFKLTLDGSDDWLGQQVSIMIDGAQVWYDGVFGDSGAITPTHWRGGTWDGTSTFQSLCAMTPVELTFVTGANGTADNPYFYLKGDFSASPYRYYLNQPGDLQPGLTNTYDFLVPMSFCQMTGWQLDKPATAGIDDDWLANEIDITVDSTLVYFDKVFYQVGPIHANSNTGGTWDGTDAYKNRCSTVGLIPPPETLVTIQPTLVQIPGGLVLTAPVAQVTPAPTLIRINPNLILPPASPTLIPINRGVFQPIASPTPPPNPGPGVTQCQGAPVPRLYVGGQGRVTPGAPNRLRAQPNTTSAVLANIPAGGVFSVIGGPNCGGGYTWWQVNYNGIIGWTAEGTGSTYYVEPA